MITRTISKATVEQIEAIAHRADVAPFVGAVGRTVRDIEDFDKMVPLTLGDGCMLFLENEPGIWRADFLMVPGCEHNLNDARAMITHIFEQYNAIGVWGPIAHVNPRSWRFAESLPATLVGEDEANRIYAIRREDWLTKREQRLN